MSQPLTQRRRKLWIQPLRCDPRARIVRANRRDVARFLEYRKLHRLRSVIAELAQPGLQLLAADALAIQRLLDDAAVADQHARLAAHQMSNPDRMRAPHGQTAM